MKNLRYASEKEVEVEVEIEVEVEKKQILRKKLRFRMIFSEVDLRDGLRNSTPHL